MVSPAQFSRMLHVSVALTALLILCGCSPQFILTRTRAALGDSEAQYNLGVMYQNGQGVTQDYARAVRWFHDVAVRSRSVPPTRFRMDKNERQK